MKTVRAELGGAVFTVTLNRPEVRNAFNEELIEELREVFRAIPGEARVVVLAGAGKVFCAGADVGWMRRSREYTEEENRKDAASMAEMLRAIDECPQPVIGRVHGHALGGACGLIACCDIVVAVEGAKFGYTEARLGIIPAVISTFVLPKIGVRAARRYFLTAERFQAEEALAMGLVHEVVKPERLDERIQQIVDEILKCGPVAVRAAKRLIREAAGMSREEAIRYTVETIARLRVTPEAQEGLGAFLEKRKPNWVP